MDRIADTGAGWFCSAVQAAGWSTLEVQTCGGADARFVVGLATMAVVIVLSIFASWRLLEVRETRARS